jgi:hypothetical protein
MNKAMGVKRGFQLPPAIKVSLAKRRFPLEAKYPN